MLHLVCLEVELDVDSLVVLVHRLEGVGPVAVHVPEKKYSLGNNSVLYSIFTY